MCIIYSKITDKDISKYTIYGERHTGTKAIEILFKYNSSLNITWQYGWKHWFGFTDKNKIIDCSDTLFFCCVRNPVDWILAFFKQPHSVPNKNTRSINNFLFNEWYSVQETIMNETEILHDRNFLTQHRYKNIFELRKYKIYYLRQVLPIICRDMILVSYEDLTLNTKNIFSFLQKNIRQINNNNCYNMIKPMKPYYCSTDVKKNITKNIDWNFEKTIGYTNNYA